jgi:GTPase
MEQYLDEVSAALPEASLDLANLRRVLLNNGDILRVAVYGKFNHGKSTLLNVLIGKEVFKVSDKRETTEVTSFGDDAIEWIDTPGLDADVGGDDDRLATRANREHADVVLFVHSVRVGELDRHEVRHLQALCEAGRDAGNVLLVLTQIEQLETEELVRTRAAIDVQLDGLPRLEQLLVSAQRQLSGTPALVARSGIDALRTRIDELRQARASARKVEIKQYVAKLLDALQQREKDTAKRMAEFQTTKEQRRDRLKQDALALQREVASKMGEI